jgi:hypothetical protein
LFGRTTSSISSLTVRTESAEALVGPSFLADDAADPAQLLAQVLVGGDDLVERVGDLASHPRPVRRQASREVPAPERDQDLQQGVGVQLFFRHPRRR